MASFCLPAYLTHDARLGLLRANKSTCTFHVMPSNTCDGAVMGIGIHAISLLSNFPQVPRDSLCNGRLSLPIVVKLLNPVSRYR